MSWGEGPWGGQRGQHPDRKEKRALSLLEMVRWGWGIQAPKEPFREAILLSLGAVQSWWLVLLRGGVRGEGEGL